MHLEGAKNMIGVSQSEDIIGAREVAWSDKDHEFIFASFCIFILIYL